MFFFLSHCYLQNYTLQVLYLYITALFKNPRTLKFKIQLTRLRFLLPSIFLAVLLGKRTLYHNYDKTIKNGLREAIQ